MPTTTKKHLAASCGLIFVASSALAVASPVAASASSSASVASTASAQARATKAQRTQLTFESRVLRLTNKARQSARMCGSQSFRATSPLKYNAALQRSARAHSADMASRNYFSHYSPEGSSPFDRIHAQGYQFRRAAENIAAGQRTPKAVVRAWLRSPSHCSGIMDPRLRELGVGYVKGGGRYVHYWTQDFGSR